jgi:peptide/nickel transport system permease protein
MTGRFGFVGKRLLQTPFLILVVLLAVFLMLKMVPGDPARQVAGPRASEETIQAVRESLGLDQPLWQQFARYVGRVLQGDFGTTANGGVAVRDVISSGASVTMTVLGLTALFSIVISVVLAVIATRRPNGIVDRVVQIAATFSIGIPTFWLSIVLLATVALPTGWFPVGGWGETPAEHFRSAVLPALALSAAVSPILLASLRSSILEVRQADYYTAARAAGLEGHQLLRKVVLRNAALPPVALLAALMTVLLSGAVVVESTFGLPGLGLSLVQGAQRRDFNVVQGLTIVFAVAVVIVNLLGDLLIAILDPRVEL